MKKVFGIILILLGVLFTPLTFINLGLSITELVKLIKNYNSYGLGHFIGGFTITLVISIINFLCYRYGIKLISKKRENIAQENPPFNESSNN